MWFAQKLNSSSGEEPYRYLYMVWLWALAPSLFPIPPQLIRFYIAGGFTITPPFKKMTDCQSSEQHSPPAGLVLSHMTLINFLSWGRWAKARYRCTWTPMSWRASRSCDIPGIEILTPRTSAFLGDWVSSYETNHSLKVEVLIWG